MAQRFFVVMSLAAGVTGCSHLPPRTVDARAALLKPFAVTGSEHQENLIPSDHQIHGTVSVGTGIGSRRSYNPGASSSPEGLTGAGSDERRLVPEGW